ncbi:protein kinase-like protein [Stackebrandtia albiflava]|uniref:Protein kinase-like protein n=1 Tax=Stackebrandtia albiflava TaxID=406432 RepID=A0A562V426_9ACTN|nr:class III lanthionine synthetase LanKC [Stackebrandtia albiflava]TWJ12605.1 protein kinase-like protein [Stackebrandtia albiflava]
MYAWETFYIYCQQHPRWFEPLNRYTPEPDHILVYRELMPPGRPLRRQGLWFVADWPDGPKMTAQGWKLHVSTRAEESVAVLRAALPVLRDAGVHFKFLIDPKSVMMSGGKLWPRGSSGKFITVYPRDETVFHRVASGLREALAGFEGPYILSDRRVPDSRSVFYRYGGFVGKPRVRDDGAVDMVITAPDGTLLTDVRAPYWTAPEWIDVDPFGLPAHDDEAADDTDEPLGGRFEVTEALQFSNRGGVYRATDLHTGRPVILKEVRPHIGSYAATGNQDYVDILAKEHRLLTALADSGRFVRPVALFREWEHSFLAEEAVTGPQMSTLSISDNPVYTLELTPERMAGYWGRMRDLFGELVAAIGEAHRRDVVLGDLSWTNLLVDEDTGRLVIIDLEAAVEKGVDPPLQMYTKGVSSPRFIRSGVAAPADDYYSVGAMMFGAIVLANGFLGYRPDAIGRFLDSLSADLGLPAELRSLVAELTDHTTPVDPDAGVVGKRLAELPVGAVTAWPAVIPLSRPAHEVMVGERAERVRRDTAEAVSGVVDYLRATATPERTDRLFPGDVGVFETNPFNVAHGAAGGLLALHRVTGEVPGRFLSWLVRPEIDDRTCPPGLYFGQAGIAWVLAELGYTEYAGRLLRRAADHPLAREGHGVLHGAAGIGMAALRLWRATTDPEFLETADGIAAHLADRAVIDDRGAHWSTVGPDGEPHLPVGYGHGGSGVASFLLYHHLATGRADVLDLGRAALDFELAQAVRHNDFMTAFRADADPDGVPTVRSYWDAGTAGVLAAVARYAAVSPEDRVLDGWIDRLLPDVSRKYAVMPQLFHGLAGMGDVLIDVAELTGRPDVLAEAWRTAEGVLLFRVDAPEGVVFPGEQGLRESADFATGSAGVGLFLDRLLKTGPGTRTGFNLVLDDLLPGSGDVS